MTFTDNINALLESWGCTLSIIVLLLLYIGRKKLNRGDRLYAHMLICNIGILFFDVLSIVFDVREGMWSDIVTRISTMLTFIFSYALIDIYAVYLTNHVGERTAVSRIPLNLVRLFMSSITVMILLSQFIPIIYSFNNSIQHYQTEKFYFLSPLAGALSMAVCMATVIIYRKVLSRREIAALVIYQSFPSLAAVIQANLVEPHMTSYVNFINISITISMIVIFMILQSEEARRTARLDQEMAEARTSIMLSQIQPHFLYNALEAIGYLCHTDPPAAEKAVTEFSQFLMGNMESLTNHQPIPFTQELLHTRNYLALEKIRFEERLNIEYDTEFTDFSLPPLTLQPIVENAVRYGVTRRPEGGTVRIRSFRQENTVRIIISDDGIGFDPLKPRHDGRSHIGIQNVNSRLQQICGGSMTIDSIPGQGTVALITIPLGKDDD